MTCSGEVRPTCATASGVDAMESGNNELKNILDLLYTEKVYMSLFIAEKGLNGEFSKWLHEKMKPFNRNPFKKGEEDDRD